MAADVIVIGAGAAGLSAARELAHAGMRVEIVEARDRFGGRILTRYDPELNYPVELGAEFVHGMAPEIWLPLQQRNLNLNEVEGSLWCSIDGDLQPCNFFSQVEKVLAAMDDRHSDESFLDFISRRFPDDNHAEAKEQATRYVSGFNAADPGLVSVHWLVHSRQAEEQIEGDRAFRIVGGYETLLHELGRDALGCPVELTSTSTSNDRSTICGANMQLKTIVDEISWREGRVCIGALTSSGKATFEAPYTLVALPLGVLQSRSIQFSPELPEQKLHALEHLVMGKAVRVTLCFHERFWDKIRSTDDGKTLSNLSFLFSQDEKFPTWWTQMPEQLPIITGWSAARSAEQLSGMTEGRIVDNALDSLGKLLGLEKAKLRKQLSAAYFHDWNSDPFSHGAYSYVKAGGEGCQATLAAPIANTLFFAGEHTDTTGHNGTVHGAIASGQRAAKEILKVS